MKKILTFACVIALASCGSPEQESAATQMDSINMAAVAVDTSIVASDMADTTVTASLDTTAQ